MRRFITTSTVLAAMLIAHSGMTTAQTMQATRIANGYSNPVYATTAPGDASRMFVVEQSSGRINIVDPATGTKATTPFLTVSGLSTGGERGLLGLAFHPDYANNGKFYVNMTGGRGATFIREYQRDTADLADAQSARTILTFSQPFGNHNGGWIGFGPDGMLHVATGDGGSGNDPQNNSQTLTNNLLGKMLRIDVNGDDFPNESDRNYAIPADNPFVGQTGDDEILHYGLRNPWRSSFDRLTGDLYIGDVGQNRIEEIDLAPAGESGINFGWRLREGTIATPSNGVGGPAPAGAIEPIYEYQHGGGDNQGGSVTGGYAYRGPIQALQGHYFFGDFQNRRIWSIKWDESESNTFDATNFSSFTDWTDVVETSAGGIGALASFGEDEAGNLYVVDYGGEVFRIDDATFVSCDFVGNGNGCDITDLDALYDELGGSNSRFDLNADGTINEADIGQWLVQASATDNPAKANASHVYAAGDIDLNGQVDSRDLGLLLNNFGDTNSSGWARGNLNGDANVDSDDLAFLLNNFEPTSAVATVPEVATPRVLLLLLGLLAFVRRR